jgi:uncharacterized membrane protein YphA (DoxX/SURF4 family)
MRTLDQWMAAPYVALFAGYFIGLILLLAGVSKLIAVSRFVEAVRGYKLLPEAAVGVVAKLLPWWEVLAGAWLLAGVVRVWAARSALFLFLLFAAAISINLLRGRRYISCGCFGPGKGRRIGWGLVGRNLLLSSMAALVVRAETGGLLSLSKAEAVYTLIVASAAIAIWWLGGMILDVWRLPNPADYLEASRRHQ